MFIRLIFSFFLLPVCIFADWVGSPSLPAIIEEGSFLSDRSLANYRLGFDGAYAFNERVHFARKERDLGFSSLKVKGPSYMPFILMNLKERIEFYLQPGVIQFDAHFTKDMQNFSRRSRFGFAGKAGTRAILLEIKDTTIGADVHYRFFDAYLKKRPSELYDDLLWSLREWQIGVGISQKIKCFSPYFGVAIRQSKQRIPSLGLSNKKKLHASQKHKNGIYAGLIISRGSSVLLGIEGHFYHESSLSGSLQLRF